MIISIQTILIQSEPPNLIVLLSKCSYYGLFYIPILLKLNFLLFWTYQLESHAYCWMTYMIKVKLINTGGGNMKLFGRLN